MKTQAYRHGEICFEVIKKLPKGLKQANQHEFLKGSHGHPHGFDNGSLYLKDEKGNPMRVVSFNVQNMKEDLIFYHCFCPSTKREYYLQTNKKTCVKAKSMQFGLEEVTWLNEW
jgi:hypothetical protein